MIPPPFAFPEVASGCSPESRTDRGNQRPESKLCEWVQITAFSELLFFSAVGGSSHVTGSYGENGCGMNVQSCLVPPGPLL